MEWLQDGWETHWMHTRNWPGSITTEELQKRLQSMEKIGKTPSGTGTKAQQHMTIYMQELTLSLFAAAKWESEHRVGDKDTAVHFNLLYSADLSKYLEAYMQHPAGVDEQEINELTVHAAAFLIDQCKLVLRSLAESSKSEPRRVSHGIHLLRALCTAIDRKTPYHEQHADMPLPSWLPSHPFRRFTNAASLPPGPLSDEPHGGDSPLCSKFAGLKMREPSPELSGDSPRRTSSSSSSSSSSCRCSDCRPRRYLRIKVLLEHFGNGSSIPGFQLLVSLLYATVSQKLSLELGEVILRLVAIAMEFLKDHKKNMFLAPSLDMLRHVYACYASQRLDKMSLSTVTMIMSHLGLIFHHLLPREIADQLTCDMQKRQRDQFLQFLHPTPAAIAVDNHRRAQRT